MRRSVFHWILIACFFGSLPGCQRFRQQSEPTGEHSRDLSNETQTAAASMESSRETGSAAAGRGRGRGLSGQAYGRGRAAYQALALTPQEEQGFEITTVRAAYRPLQSLHSAMGKVLAPQTRMAKVSYAFPARIAAIHVQIGDWVEKGQRVLTVQSEEVGRAKSEYYKAVADLELARSSYERERRLFGRGVGAQKNALASEVQFKVAQTNLDAAEKRLHVLGFSEADVKAMAESHQINPEIALFAPISGKVIEQKAVLGSMADENAELMTIMDPSVLWVDAEIFERDIGRIRIGQDVRVSVPAWPGEIFTGKVSYIGDLLNQETRTVTVRTEVQNRGFKLKPGMFADVIISLNGSQKLLAVPAEALLDDRNQKIVFVKEGGRYIPRVVDAGQVQNGFCAISSGLQEGEEVVVKGNYTLKSRMYDELLKKAGVH